MHSRQQGARLLIEFVESSAECMQIRLERNCVLRYLLLILMCSNFLFISFCPKTAEQLRLGNRDNF